MRLARLHLCNITRHADLDWTFQSGIAAIVGPNGSGKSTALDAAYACLSGDFARHCCGKEGWIRQQAVSGELSFIELEAEHDGNRFTIRRSLRPNKQFMLLNGQTFTGAADIKEQLEEALGITPALLDNYVFVAQSSMNALLATPAERARQFAQLCQTERAEKCWVMLGDQINLDRAAADRIVDNSDDLRSQCFGYTQKRDVAEQEYRAASVGLLSDEARQQLVIQIEAFTRWHHLHCRLPGLREQELRAFEAAKAAVSAANALQASYDASIAVELQLRDAAEKARAAQSLYGLQKKAWAVRQQLQMRLAAIPADKPMLVIDLSEASAMQQMLSDAQHKLVDRQQLLNSCDGKVECPTCHTPTDQLQGKIDEAKKEVPALVEMIAAVKQQFVRRVEFDRRVEASRREIHGNGVLRESLQKQLEAAGDVIEPVLDANLDVTIRQHVESQAKLTQLANQLKSALAEKEQAKTRHQGFKQQRTEVEEELVKLEVTEDAYKSAQQQLETDRQAQVSCEGLRQRIATYNEMIVDTERRLAELSIRVERGEKARRWIALLERVRSVLHRDNLPRVVHEVALENLVVTTNETLEEFSVPFRVTCGDDLSMTATFDDGTVVPAAALSGGQTMVLSVAFRLAVNQLFAGDLGLLCLDEPSAALDQESIDKMTDVFANMGRIARQRGFQVIVITHETALSRSFGQVLTLGDSAAAELAPALAG